MSASYLSQYRRCRNSTHGWLRHLNEDQLLLIVASILANPNYHGADCTCLGCHEETIDLQAINAELYRRDHCIHLDTKA